MIIGNLGADPEMRYTANGAPVTTFSVATSRQYKRSSDGERIEETEWFNIVTWNRTAETCSQYLSKGSKVYVEGRMSTRSWDDQSTGQKKYKTELVADQVKFLSPQNSQQSLSDDSSDVQENKVSPPSEIDPDDLPF
ncbi:MAG: single-strand DNA-binding protein [Chloroflexi bacterium]|jgi:single-strand DNA-binding protein|nr:MAG: single-strand DNA-binding protein [Chloroflexota bacterium]|tara:strand:- start:1711 stop:2121 length:411 start_codon:yes stop_codon:yes gene_type:complete